MALCSCARGQNLDAALVSFLDVLGDKHFSAFGINPPITSMFCQPGGRNWPTEAGEKKCL
jgi:hypothetical protein